MKISFQTARLHQSWEKTLTISHALWPLFSQWVSLKAKIADPLQRWVVPYLLVLLWEARGTGGPFELTYADTAFAFVKLFANQLHENDASARLVCIRRTKKRGGWGDPIK